MSRDDNIQCPIYTEHQLSYDEKFSSIHRSVYRCPCGHTEVEYEDAGTGA